MKTSYRRIAILTCVIAAALWSTFQRTTEEILKVNGSFERKDRERNRRINAAYVKLWLADHRFQWAGLAAFASKQVGCGLLHSAQTIEKNRKVREAVMLSIAQMGVVKDSTFSVPARSNIPVPTPAGA